MTSTMTPGQQRTAAAIAARKRNKQLRMAEELRASGRWKVTYLCVDCGADTGSDGPRCESCTEQRDRQPPGE